MPQFVFETVPRIICEQGGADRLGEIAQGLDITRLFLVTDAGLIKANLIAGALASCAAANVQVTVFSDVLADPPEVSVQAAVALAVAAGVDGVVGFGGGSSLDTAKLVALLVRTP
jgi:alcohol dehydrogenase class IV